MRNVKRMHLLPCIYVPKKGFPEIRILKIVTQGLCFECFDRNESNTFFVYLNGICIVYYEIVTCLYIITKFYRVTVYFTIKNNNLKIKTV